MTDKPLHVRVAESIGCQVRHKETFDAHEIIRTPAWECGCFGGTHGVARFAELWGWPWLAKYDTDWAATGPLIEKYRLILTPAPSFGDWKAASHGIDGMTAYNSAPLVAVCRVLILLKEAGKL